VGEGGGQRAEGPRAAVSGPRSVASGPSPPARLHAVEHRRRGAARRQCAKVRLDAFDALGHGTLGLLALLGGDLGGGAALGGAGGDQARRGGGAPGDEPGGEDWVKYGDGWEMTARKRHIVGMQLAVASARRRGSAADTAAEADGRRETRRA